MNKEMNKEIDKDEINKNENRSNRISENTRKAKLNFLNTNVQNKFTTIWDTIVIEESINNGQNTYIKEQIPFDLSGYEILPPEQQQQRPSTTDLMFDSSRPSTSNDQFPSSTKSLSPKYLDKAAVFNQNNLRSNLNKNLTFKLDVDNDVQDDNVDSNYELINDYDKFKNNFEQLNPAELQLLKWKEMKRFKNQYGIKNNQPLVRSFENSQTVEPISSPIDQSSSFYKQPTSDDLNARNSFSSSSDSQSVGRLLPIIENSDYYASLDETNTKLSGSDDKLVDHLVNFEDNLEDFQSDNQSIDQKIDDFKINQIESDYKYPFNVQNQANEKNDLETDLEFTPRTSIVSELNEHNFIDSDDNQAIQEIYLNPTDYEQYLREEKEVNQLQNQSDEQNQLNHQTNEKDIEEEFDKIFLDYPNIDKFVNNIDSSTNSPLNDYFVNSSISSPYQATNQSDHLIKKLPAQQIKIPSEILEIEEPLIRSRNSNRSSLQSSNLRQSVKRKSVIVQTSRPTSLLTNGDDEIKHLLTIVKNDQLTYCAPIKDVYVINRRVYRIQKLASFNLAFRNLLDLIRLKLRKQLSMDDNQEQSKEERNKKVKESKWNRIKLILKWTLSFLFTTPGLCFVLVVYCLFGAFLFEVLERENNLNEIRKMIKYKNETVHNFLKLNLRNLSRENWIDKANKILEIFEQEVIDKVEMNGYSGNAFDKWDLSDSFLYSVTVISTIGYGKLSPKTFAGQAVTIIYAVIGIPIMLLFITNLGTIMASIFRVSYDTICCYLCNLSDKEKQNLNQDNSNAPVTVSEQLTEPKTSIETTENKAKQKPGKLNLNVQEQETILKNDDQDNPERSQQDQNQETDSIVVFQNNEYHTNRIHNPKERAYYLTFNGEHTKNRVPIRIVVLIVICYICLGGLLFSTWESSGNENDEKSGNDFFKWAYFCFITLSTIGFGDIVPGDSIKLRQDMEGSLQILFCCVYLIVGLSLLYSSFNLVQEEIIFKMRKICESLGMDVNEH